MSYVKFLVLIATFFWGVAASAQTSILKDSWIANIADAVRDADASAAETALSRSANGSVRSFAEKIKRDYLGEIGQSLNQLGLTPEDNELGQSLKEIGKERSKDLAALSGPAFDKAYLENEVAYNVFAIGVMEVTVIPSIRNPVLKKLVESRLALLKSHKKDAEALMEKLK